MVALSITAEAVFGLTWPSWKRFVAAVEQLGFAGLYCSDHLTLPCPPGADALELIVALTYVADHTERITFGSLVAPLSFRDPLMLARQAAVLDNLSEGRMVLGIGAGWFEPEHVMFGYDLGDVSTRMNRLEEGLEVITRLLRSDEPLTHAGQYYHLQDAVLRPRPQRPGGPRILIGGGAGRRILRLAGRYADVWNTQAAEPAEFQDRSARLDVLVREAGREPRCVRRTMIQWVLCGRTPAELEQRVQWVRRTMPGLENAPLDVVLDTIRTSFGVVVGTPAEIVPRIRAYGAAGLDELMVQWAGFDDLEGLELVAEHILPQVA